MVTKEITTKTMMVTPALAASWLASSNIDNRVVKPGTVARYADRIRAGEWVIVDQLISFDLNGRLLNGQHRLMAVVKTNISIEALVGFGFPEEAYKYLDQGHNRTKADIHKVARNVSAFVSALAKIIDHTKGTSFTEFENIKNYRLKIWRGEVITAEDFLMSLTKSNAKVITSGASLACLVYWVDQRDNQEYLTNLFNETVLGWHSLERQRTVSPRVLSLFQSIKDRKVGTWNSAEVVRKFLSFYDPSKRDFKRISESTPIEVEKVRAWAKKVMVLEHSSSEHADKTLCRAGAI